MASNLNVSNNGKRYTPSLSNRAWFIFALVADLGWLLNLIFVIAYLVIGGFNADVPLATAFDVLELISVIAIQIGYGFVIYLSLVGERAQQTKMRKNLGFGLPSAASLSAALFGIG